MIWKTLRLFSGTIKAMALLSKTQIPLRNTFCLNTSSIRISVVLSGNLTCTTSTRPAIPRIKSAFTILVLSKARNTFCQKSRGRTLYQSPLRSTTSIQLTNKVSIRLGKADWCWHRKNSMLINNSIWDWVITNQTRSINTSDLNLKYKCTIGINLKLNQHSIRCKHKFSLWWTTSTSCILNTKRIVWRCASRN